MDDSKKKIGKKVRLILTNDFNYSGMVLDEDDISLTIRDKYNVEVQLLKSEIKILEVLEND
jgi:hypothetical protein